MTSTRRLADSPVCGICGAPIRRFSATLWVHDHSPVVPHAAERSYVAPTSEWVRLARQSRLPAKVYR